MDLDRYKSDDIQRDQRQLEDLKKNLVNLLRIKYTAIVALMVCAFHKDNPFIMLLPIFISIVIFFIEITYRKKICRNAAYLIVFYGQEIAPEWESRFHKYRKKSLKITRAREFLKKFSKIIPLKAFHRFSIKKGKLRKFFHKIKKIIIKFFYVSLSESSSIQNFYRVELFFIFMSFSYLFFKYLMDFPMYYMLLIYMAGLAFYIKVCWFFGKIFYYYKVDYEKEIDAWIDKWGKVKADEKITL